MTYLPSFTTNKSKVFHLTTLSLALALSGCGGDSVDSIAPKPDIGVISTPNPNASDEETINKADIFISLDKTELNTGSDKITATILVTDENGGVLPGVPVELSIEDSNKYGLTLSKPSMQTTDDKGVVEVDIVQNGTNINSQINHQTQLKVVVKKTQKKSEQTVPIIVTGTQVQNVTASTSVLGVADGFRITGDLIDGNGNPVNKANISLYNNGEVVQTGETTNGKFAFDLNSSSLTKSSNGNYVLNVELQGNQGVSQQILNIIEIPSIDSVDIKFANIPDILVTARRPVVIDLPNAKNGDIVTISTNKGEIYKGTKEEVGFNGSLSQNFTVKNKRVIFYIRSEAVGPATITAQYNGNTQKTSVNFVSTIPNKIYLQAGKSVLGKGESTPITVQVYDKNDNPVQNALVSFSVLTSSGVLDKSSVLTGANGLATVNYTAGNNATGVDAVSIGAEVKSVRLADGSLRTVTPTLKGEISLSVQTNSSHVGFALSDKISSPDEIYYIKTGSIFVTNNVGQAASNQQVTISLVPDAYSTGLYKQILKKVKVTAPTSTDGGSSSSTGGTQSTTPVEKEVLVWAMCYMRHLSEDKNQNGFLDPDEDTNGNKKLDPINAATILRNTENTSDSSAGQAKNVTFTTDNTGRVDFVIRYPKEYANWFTANITVNTRVDGSESRSSRPITFPRLIDDVDLTNNIMPNRYSPFGLNHGSDANCTIIEEAE